LALGEEGKEMKGVGRGGLLRASKEERTQKITRRGSAKPDPRRKLPSSDCKISENFFGFPEKNVLGDLY
jgi:hypothetical protein